MKCVSKIAIRIHISEKTNRHALNYMFNVIASRISEGKDRMILAEGVLYLSCRYCIEPRIQLKAARAAGISEATLRNRSREIFEKIHPIFYPLRK